jgi:hypothetical protein
MNMTEADITLAKKTFDETTSEGRSAMLTWATFYNLFETVVRLMAKSQEETDAARKEYFEINAYSTALGLVDYLYVIPKCWEDQLLVFNIHGKNYKITYAGAEKRIYSYIAKYFEKNPEQGVWRDPCTRHFPSNRLLKNQ